MYFNNLFLRIKEMAEHSLGLLTPQSGINLIDAFAEIAAQKILDFEKEHQTHHKGQTKKTSLRNQKKEAEKAAAKREAEKAAAKKEAERAAAKKKREDDKKKKKKKEKL